MREVEAAVTMIVPLHSSLGNKIRPCLKKKNKNKKDKFSRISRIIVKFEDGTGN